MTRPECILDKPEPLAQELASLVSADTLVRCHEPMARRTTLRVGGPVDIYVEPASEDDLGTVLKFCRRRALPLFVLGRGSNLLVKDGGFRGVALCLSQPAFSGIEVVPPLLRCGAGARLKAVAAQARRHGLSGLEFLEGIPGGIGGALRMNAGAMGGSMFDAVESVRLMDWDGNVRECLGAEMGAVYRNCAVLKTHIALSALLRGQPASPESIQERMNQFSQRRWSSQPAAPSAGCAFKNPKAVPAGKLIEDLGLKGLRVGGASVSLEHGNFIVNDGGATARNILDLIALIQRRARAERGIELESELEIIGNETDH
jgi:UDP-N-acetylenolpyruvoylglucosamine reductase